MNLRENAAAGLYITGLGKIEVLQMEEKRKEVGCVALTQLAQ